MDYALREISEFAAAARIGKHGHAVGAVAVHDHVRASLFFTQCERKGFPFKYRPVASYELIEPIGSGISQRLSQLLDRAPRVAVPGDNLESDVVKS